MTSRVAAAYKRPRARGKPLKERSKSADETAPPALPRPRAFVVHLASDAAPPDGSLRGRAVHIASGEAAPFESLAELLRFLHAAIAQAEDGQAIDRAEAGMMIRSDDRVRPTGGRHPRH